MFTYDEIDKKKEEAQELVKQQLLKLQAKNKEFTDASKRAMETGNIQEVSSALSTVFKDGFGVLNKVIDNLKIHFNQQEINKLEEKDGLLDTVMNEWKNKGELQEDIKTKLAKSGDIAKKFLDEVEDNLSDNKELKSALSIISKFSESMKNEDEIAVNQEEEGEENTETEINQASQSQNRNKNRQRSRA